MEQMKGDDIVARPCKNTNVLSMDMTKEEMSERQQAENELRGNHDNIVAPDYLCKEAKEIFYHIVDELEATGILGNLDVSILAICSNAIYRIGECEKVLNQDLFNKEALRIKEGYVKEFFRCCNELCLSPQSRAKMANIRYQGEREAQDPLEQILKRRGN